MLNWTAINATEIDQPACFITSDGILYVTDRANRDLGSSFQALDLNEKKNHLWRTVTEVDGIETDNLSFTKFIVVQTSEGKEVSLIFEGFQSSNEPPIENSTWEAVSKRNGTNIPNQQFTFARLAHSDVFITYYGNDSIAAFNTTQDAWVTQVNNVTNAINGQFFVVLANELIKEPISIPVNEPISAPIDQPITIAAASGPTNESDNGPTNESPNNIGPTNDSRNNGFSDSNPGPKSFLQGVWLAWSASNGPDNGPKSNPGPKSFLQGVWLAWSASNGPDNGPKSNPANSFLQGVSLTWGPSNGSNNGPDNGPKTNPGSNSFLQGVSLTWGPSNGSNNGPKTNPGPKSSLREVSEGNDEELSIVETGTIVSFDFPTSPTSHYTVELNSTPPPPSRLINWLYTRYKVKPSTFTASSTSLILPSAPSGTIIFKYKLSGRPTYGVNNAVRRAEGETVGQNLAVKFFKKKDSFEREVVMLKYLQSEFVCALRDVFDISNPTDWKYVTVMDYYPKSLDNFIVSRTETMTEVYVSAVVQSLAKAIKYVHDHRIVHLDIKPGNFVHEVGDSSKWRLIDFEAARVDGEEDVDSTTLRYASPEIINAVTLRTSIKASKSMDMWSLGCTIYEAYTGSPLFPNEEEASFKLSEAYNTEYLELPLDNVKDIQARHVLEKLLVIDPTKRAKVDEILSIFE
ncbi:11166_t:CDS:2 [Paraglomus occultum]|uniref:11166_t:CDS:1 n=1 Tax=Paraglomus occultum TaxID=144539 RepID=A0A9N9FP89_9GLOM|nr:11166_t:CDS:2 [Paraglomus occultum]